MSENTTPKKKSNWTLVNGLLTCTFPLGTKVALDLTRIMEDFEAQNENIRFLMQYGVKQNVSDELAGYKGDDTNKAKMIEDRFEELVRGEIKTKREKADMVKTDVIRDRMKAAGFTDEQIAEITKK